MTTIAYRDGIMAADSLISLGSMRGGSVTKIVRSPEGRLAGGIGLMAKVVPFLRWVEGECQGDPPARGDDFWGVLVDPNGAVFYVGETGGAFPVAVDFIASGSGEEYAMGAMAMGASAIRAVEVAIALDEKSGGPILVLTRDGGAQ